MKHIIYGDNNAILSVDTAVGLGEILVERVLQSDVLLTDSMLHAPLSVDYPSDGIYEIGYAVVYAATAGYNGVLKSVFEATGSSLAIVEDDSTSFESTLATSIAVTIYNSIPTDGTRSTYFMVNSTGAKSDVVSTVDGSTVYNGINGGKHVLTLKAGTIKYFVWDDADAAPVGTITMLAGSRLWLRRLTGQMYLP